jgi:hypothetical protein
MENDMGVNYSNTLIAIADDSPVNEAVMPPRNDAKPTIAAEQYRLLADAPYTLTSEDVIFTVYADKHGIPDEERAAARKAYFAAPRACLRTSPLAKKYGWGLHSDEDGRLALVPVDSDRYRELIEDGGTRVVKAMRSSR